MQTVHNINFEPENPEQEENLEVLRQRAEAAIQMKQKAKAEAKLKQQKKHEMQQQLMQQHLMQQEVLKSMQLLKESTEEMYKNEQEADSVQMEIKPEINVKEEMEDYNEDEDEHFADDYDDSFKNDEDDYYKNDDDDDYNMNDKEEMEEEAEPWLIQMSAMTLLTITTLHQLHFGKFYRNPFLRKIFIKEEFEVKPKTLKFVASKPKPKKKRKTPGVKAGCPI